MSRNVAWTLGGLQLFVGVGAALVLWIVIQTYFIGLLSWLQPLFLAIGLVEVVLGGRLRREQKSALKPQ